MCLKDMFRIITMQGLTFVAIKAAETDAMLGST